MIETFAPVGVGIAANHSVALHGRSTLPSGLVPLLADVGERLAPAMERALARFSGGARPQVRSLGVETVAEAELAKRSEPVAGNALHEVAGGPHRLLVSIELSAVMAELDRTFGGSGEFGTDLPATLPMSAELLSARMEQLMADTFQAELASACPLHAVDRHTRYALLAPFSGVVELALLTLEVEQKPARPWLARFAVPIAGLPDLLDRRRSAQRNAVARVPADPRSRPFADVPLAIEATLIDMNVPLSRLTGLETGTVLPVAVSRSVPLRIGEMVIAHGTVGELDDRCALQITHTAASGELVS